MRPAAAAAAAWQPRLAAARGSDTASAPRSRGRLLVTAAIKVRKGKQVLCNKTLKAKEGNESEVAALCQHIAEWSRGRMADRGSGVLAFQFSEVRLPRSMVGNTVCTCCKFSQEDLPRPQYWVSLGSAVAASHAWLCCGQRT
jgi:hypothetical protein